VYRILAYHRISDEENSPLCVSPRIFRKQIHNMARWGFAMVSLRELEAARARGVKGRLVAITFDDGYEDNYTVAYPILATYEASATFFVPSSLVGEPGRLSAEQLEELTAGGFEVGSHSRTHKELPLLSDDEIYEEVADSKKELEALLGTAVESFAYPRGMFDFRCQAIVESSGYLRAVVTPRAPGHRQGQFSMERVGIYRHTGSTAFALKLLGVYSEVKRRGWTGR
jgi:peptidoglycan/xylan/chitin deacetylase (PgdA/CDA1 family)